VALVDLYFSSFVYFRLFILNLRCTFYATTFPCHLLFLSCVPFSSSICILTLWYKSSIVSLLLA
jgi:hypothetical protein